MGAATPQGRKRKRDDGDRISRDAVKRMKKEELRQELRSRGLATGGLKVYGVPVDLLLPHGVRGMNRRC